MVWAIARDANRSISQTRPWTLAQAERAGDRRATERLSAALAALVMTCRQLAAQLEPFLPDAAARITSQVTAVGGVLPHLEPVFASTSTGSLAAALGANPGAANHA